MIWLKSFTKLIQTGLGSPHFGDKSAHEVAQSLDLKSKVFHSRPKFVDFLISGFSHISYLLFSAYPYVAYAAGL
jgi:hypothetical protein